MLFTLLGREVLITNIYRKPAEWGRILEIQQTTPLDTEVWFLCIHLIISRLNRTYDNEHTIDDTDSKQTIP